MKKFFDDAMLNRRNEQEIQDIKELTPLAYAGVGELSKKVINSLKEKLILSTLPQGKEIIRALTIYLFEDPSLLEKKQYTSVFLEILQYIERLPKEAYNRPEKSTDLFHFFCVTCVLALQIKTYTINERKEHPAYFKIFSEAHENSKQENLSSAIELTSYYFSQVCKNPKTEPINIKEKILTLYSGFFEFITPMLDEPERGEKIKAHVCGLTGENATLVKDKKTDWSLCKTGFTTSTRLFDTALTQTEKTEREELNRNFSFK